MIRVYSSLSRLVSILFRKDSQDLTLRPNQSTTYTAARDFQLPAGDSSQILVSATSVSTLINKTFDADGTGNSISNIEDADIKSGAAIDASKIADGSVSSTEFQFINSLTSNAQTQLDSKLNLSGGTMTGSLDMGSNLITSVATPVSATDAVNRNYVDQAINGLSWKQPVQLASTMSLTLSGEQTVDGVLTAGSRVLVKDQSTASQNGIYVTDAGAWTRATDMDSITPLDEVNGAAVFVLLGTTNADKGFTQTATVSTFPGDSLSFFQFSSAGTPVAGNGIDISSLVVSVKHDGQGLQFSGSDLSVELDGSTLSKSASGIKVSAVPYNLVTGFTAGSVLFAGAGGNLEQDNSDLFWNDTTNSLGIGTNSPSEKLHVVGNLKVVDIGGGNTGFKIAGRIQTGDSGNAGGVWLDLNQTQFIGQETSSKLGIYNNGDWAITVDQSRNVGVGTTSPTSRLSVGASSEFQVNSTGNIVKLNNVTTSFPSSQGTANTFLKNDGSGTLTWATAPSTYSTDWVTADGTSKTVTHSLGTKDVMVQIYDKATDETIEVDTVVRTNTNTLTLTSTDTPGASGWRVLVIAVN